ncbi:MAG: H-NS histone family protein [Burkholderiales bacterium]|jgi:DNA-binding protein H-NS
MARAASLKSIETQIRRLQEKAEKLKASRKGPAIREIVRRMKAEGIALEDLQEALKAKAPRKSVGAAKPAAAAARKPVAIKYRDAATGQTWTGRGRAPTWLAEAEAAGRKRDEFLLKPAG